MLEEITNIYNEKGITEELINKISEFANLTIKIDQNDPYWSIEAQNILKLLMISNLMKGRILTKNLLNDETSNAESVKNESLQVKILSLKVLKDKFITRKIK